MFIFSMLYSDVIEIYIVARYYNHYIFIICQHLLISIFNVRYYVIREIYEKEISALICLK